VQKWHNLLYLAMDDTIDVVLNKWSVEWRTTTNLAVDGSKFIT